MTAAAVCSAALLAVLWPEPEVPAESPSLPVAMKAARGRVSFTQRFDGVASPKLLPAASVPVPELEVCAYRPFSGPAVSGEHSRSSAGLKRLTSLHKLGAWNGHFLRSPS